MRIMTDSGASLEVTPTQTVPLPPSTPEVQSIPAGGFTPAQVVTLERQAAAEPPVTPVHPVPQLVPVAPPPPPPAPPAFEPARGLASADTEQYRPVGVLQLWRIIVGILKTSVPGTSAKTKALADSLIQVFR